LTVTKTLGLTPIVVFYLLMVSPPDTRVGLKLSYLVPPALSRTFVLQTFINVFYFF